jgi:hypothetical protein
VGMGRYTASATTLQFVEFCRIPCLNARAAMASPNPNSRESGAGMLGLRSVPLGESNSDSEREVGPSLFQASPCGLMPTQ